MVLATMPIVVMEIDFNSRNITCVTTVADLIGGGVCPMIYAGAPAERGIVDG